MSRDQQMVRRQIYLTAQEVKALAAISRRTGITVSEHVRRAIDAYVKEQK